MRTIKILLLALIFSFLLLITFSKSFRDKLIVIGMIGVGYVLYPESSHILYHYCFSDGQDLYLNSDYVKTSPVVISELKNMKVGDKKVVHFSPKLDRRLSYSLSTFILEKEEDSIYVYQYIDFDKSGRIYTILDFGVREVKIYDNIVHTFHCTPYWVRFTFSLN